jgi:hypothetical protein
MYNWLIVVNKDTSDFLVLMFYQNIERSTRHRWFSSHLLVPLGGGFQDMDSGAEVCVQIYACIPSRNVWGVRETGLGKGEMKPGQFAAQTSAAPTGSSRAAWPFRAFLNWGKGARPLHSGWLPIGCGLPLRSVTLGQAVPFSRGQVQQPLEVNTPCCQRIWDS